MPCVNLGIANIESIRFRTKQYPIFIFLTQKESAHTSQHKHSRQTLNTFYFADSSCSIRALSYSEHRLQVIGR